MVIVESNTVFCSTSTAYRLPFATLTRTAAFVTLQLNPTYTARRSSCILGEGERDAVAKARRVICFLSSVAASRSIAAYCIARKVDVSASSIIDTVVGSMSASHYLLLLEFFICHKSVN